MSPRRKVSCVLCHLSEQTTVTGALSIKDEVSAHQNCLLFSSGIYCKNTPEFDDLFGFDVEDVEGEVKRGRKLLCRECGRKGATAGCEVGRCKKTYHYPCAVQAGAKTVEDEDQGKYALYCAEHYLKRQSERRSRPADERPASSPAASRGDSAAASVYSSDSNLSRSATHLPSKRRHSDSDEQEELYSKRKNGSCARRRIIDDSPNSGDNEPNTEMEIYAPLESDLEDSAHSTLDDHIIRTNAESPRGGAAENNQQVQDEDATLLHSDAESESLLSSAYCKEPQSPAVIKVEHSSPMALNVNHGVLQSAEPPLAPYSQGPLNTNIPSPPSHPPVSSIDAVSFWKSCNAAGCTQAIFTDFLHEMNEIATRIQSDQASQEDCEFALKVITDSGKLMQLVTKQTTELQRKQTELKTSVEVMNKVIAALKNQLKP